MTPREALERSQTILTSAGIDYGDLKVANFIQYAHLVADVVKETWSRKRCEETPWLNEWAGTWRRMHDQFDSMVAADPMLLYLPKHSIAEAFHGSQAYVRYFMAGNRTSKTQSGYADDYFVSTGQHRWRQYPDPPSGVGIIAGLPFTRYASKVFEAKFLEGEEDNPLSPMFPQNGKWLYHYDARTFTITLSCPRCAQAGTPRDCSHPKSKITLFSVEQGHEVIEAFTLRQLHIDEHVPLEFFHAGKQRVASAEGGSIIITGTPLYGTDAWEKKLLQDRFEGPKAGNLKDPLNPEALPYVSMHQISQFDAGIVPHDVIRANMQDMDEFEIESRIYGRPAPLARDPVFDRHRLAALRKRILNPRRGFCEIARAPLGQPGQKEHAIVNIYELEASTDLEFIEDLHGPLRVWKAPVKGATYLAACDTASGLSPGGKGRDPDASCCSILRVHPAPTGVALEMVAQFHNWINPSDYAVEIAKLGYWYNLATVAVELTGGLGRAVVLELKNRLFYPMLFRDTQKPEYANFGLDARFGLETNVSTKPQMIAALQKMIKENRILIPCADTIREMVAFGQVKVTKDGNPLVVPKFQGMGEKDDRVITLALGAYLVLTSLLIAELAKFTESAPQQTAEDAAEWATMDDEMDSNQVSN